MAEEREVPSSWSIRPAAPRKPSLPELRPPPLLRRSFPHLWTRHEHPPRLQALRSPQLFLGGPRGAQGQRPYLRQPRCPSRRSCSPRRQKSNMAPVRSRLARKISVRELLSASSLEAVLPIRRREVQRMVEKIRAKEGSVVEVREVVFLTALNMIVGMLWGGTVDDEGVGKEFKKAMDGLVEYVGKANISDFFPVLAPLDIQGVARKWVRCRNCYVRIFDSIFEDRRKNMDANEGGPDKQRDFLQVMLELLDKGGDSQVPMKIDHVKGVFLDLVTGGTDTTSTTVEWTMAEILNNPDIMKKVQEELDEVVGKNRCVEESDIPRLHYLNAVLKEIFRLHPAVPLLVPYSPSSSCTVGGFTIPKGTKVFINVWAIHREPSFWKDPLKFEPERFLSWNDNYDYSGNNFNYLPFGSGRRICPGISLGEKMVMYLLASLLHSFEWRLPKGTEMNLKEKFGIVLKKENPLVAIPSGRLSKTVFSA